MRVYLFSLVAVGGHVLFGSITVIALAVIFPSPGANCLHVGAGLMSAITKILALPPSFQLLGTFHHSRNFCARAVYQN